MLSHFCLEVSIAAKHIGVIRGTTHSFGKLALGLVQQGVPFLRCGGILHHFFLDIGVEDVQSQRIKRLRCFILGTTAQRFGSKRFRLMQQIGSFFGISCIFSKFDFEFDGIAAVEAFVQSSPQLIKTHQKLPFFLRCLEQGQHGNFELYIGRNQFFIVWIEFHELQERRFCRVKYIFFFLNAFCIIYGCYCFNIKTKTIYKTF